MYGATLVRHFLHYNSNKKHMLLHSSAQNNTKKGIKSSLPLTYKFISFFEIYMEDMETKAIKKQKIISWKNLGRENR